jgi:arylsulfatase
METVDEEFLAASLNFIDRNAKAGTPFFCWFNSTCTHIFTHRKKESIGVTGLGPYPDGMVDIDAAERSRCRIFKENKKRIC